MDKEILLEQFTACHGKNGWFVALANALEGLTAGQDGWKPENLDNSIWENVNHLIFWNERSLQQYGGELTKPEGIENKGMFLSGDTDRQATLQN
jgi:hypothetical protein